MSVSQVQEGQELTMQEAFNLVWQHCVVNKMPPSINKINFLSGRTGLDCMYRSGENNCCFIGVIIPDSRYKHELEGATISYTLFQSLKEKEWKHLVDKFLGKLQSCHDQNAESDNFHKDAENDLRCLAIYYKLQIP